MPDGERYEVLREDLVALAATWDRYVWATFAGRDTMLNAIRDDLRNLLVEHPATKGSRP